MKIKISKSASSLVSLFDNILTLDTHFADSKIELPFDIDDLIYNTNFSKEFRSISQRYSDRLIEIKDTDSHLIDDIQKSLINEIKQLTDEYEN